ncbi:hypothetical protein M2277_000446 [Paenibacillus sp. LBL]|nr:hypothetical protein [Paenibacillus sp. LBL]
MNQIEKPLFSYRGTYHRATPTVVLRVTVEGKSVS